MPVLLHIWRLFGTNIVKNRADALIFHMAICAEAPQIAFDHRDKTAFADFVSWFLRCASEWRI